MRRLYFLFLIVTLLIPFLIEPHLVHPVQAEGPITRAKAAALIDVSSSRILYEQNGNERLPIASLTKIMTAIVAIEEGDLKSKVKVGKNAVGVEGSSIYLQYNEELSLEDLLYGLMLRSGNDAAMAIAEHIGGSMEGFVYLMNRKAELLGLKNTHFMNPHGLDHRDHYASAHDLALLTAYALQNPTFRTIVSTKVKTAPLPGEKWDRKWVNKNKMLRLYPGGDGVKTGYTKIAKRCLASSATRDGRQLAAIVLNDGDDWNDSMKLLDYGFQEYQLVEIIPENYTIEEDWNGKSYLLKVLRSSTYPLKEGELKEISSKVEMNESLFRQQLPPFGYLHLYLQGEEIDRIPLTRVEPDRDSMAKRGSNDFLRTWGFVLEKLFLGG